MLGAFALTEPGAGTDAAAGKTTAVLDGDEYVLNGSKIFITNGGYAGVYIVTAMTDPAAGTRGISAFIVEADAPGFSVGETRTQDGHQGLQHHPAVLLGLPHSRRTRCSDQEGKGFKIAMATLDGGRIGVAAQALGIAQGALDAAVAYAKERVQFGKPIAALQAIQWMIADMATEIDAARLLVYRAAWNKDNGLPYGAGGIHGEAVRLGDRDQGRRTRPSRSTAGTATPRATRSSAPTATRRSPNCTRARQRCSAWSSPEVSCAELACAMECSRHQRHWHPRTQSVPARTSPGASHGVGQRRGSCARQAVHCAPCRRLPGLNAIT